MATLYLGPNATFTSPCGESPDRVDFASLSAGEVGCLAGAMITVQVRSVPLECEMGMYVLGRLGIYSVCECREHAGCASGRHYHSARGAVFRWFEACLSHRLIELTSRHLHGA